MRKLLFILILIAIFGLLLAASGKGKRNRGRRNRKQAKTKNRGRPNSNRPNRPNRRGKNNRADGHDHDHKPDVVPNPPPGGDDEDEADRRFYCPLFRMACDVRLNQSEEVIFNQTCPEGDCMDGPHGSVTFNDIDYNVHWCIPPREVPSILPVPNLSGLSELGCSNIPAGGAARSRRGRPRRGRPRQSKIPPPRFIAFWEDACEGSGDCKENDDDDDDDDDDEDQCIERINDFVEEEGADPVTLSFCEDYDFIRRKNHPRDVDQDKKFFCPVMKAACDVREEGAADADVIFSQTCPVGDCTEGPQGQVTMAGTIYDVQWCSEPPEDFDWIQYKIDRMDEENPDLSGLEDICPGISKRAKDNNKDFWSFLRRRYCRLKEVTSNGEVVVEEYPERECKTGSTCGDTVYTLTKDEKNYNVQFCNPENTPKRTPFWEQTCDPGDSTSCQSDSGEAEECIDRIQQFKVNPDAEPSTLSFCEDFRFSKPKPIMVEGQRFFCPAAFMACSVTQEGQTDSLFTQTCPEDATCTDGPTGTIQLEDTNYNFQWCPEPSEDFDWFQYLLDKFEDLKSGEGADYSNLEELCTLKLRTLLALRRPKGKKKRGQLRAPVSRPEREYWEFRYCSVRTVEDGAVLNFPDLTTCPDGTACPDNPVYNVTYKNTELTVRVCPNDVTPFWEKNCEDNDDCPNSKGEDENECTERVKNFKEDPDAADDTAVSLSFCDDFTFFDILKRGRKPPKRKPKGKPKSPKRKKQQKKKPKEKGNKNKQKSKGRKKGEKKKGRRNKKERKSNLRQKSSKKSKQKQKRRG